MLLIYVTNYYDAYNVYYTYVRYTKGNIIEACVLVFGSRVRYGLTKVIDLPLFNYCEIKKNIRNVYILCNVFKQNGVGVKRYIV